MNKKVQFNNCHLLHYSALLNPNLIILNSFADSESFFFYNNTAFIRIFLIFNYIYRYITFYLIYKSNFS